MKIEAKRNHGDRATQVYGVVSDLEIAACANRVNLTEMIVCEIGRRITDIVMAKVAPAVEAALDDAFKPKGDA
jgi:hypothetical protein